jgi:hypothetical protein
MSNKLKTAKELGLPEEHYCALVKTLDALENNKIRHVTRMQLANWPFESVTKIRTFDKMFSMRAWKSGYACGTVACIGGTAELLGGVDMEDGAVGGDELNDLFYPDGCEGAWDATPKQAAKALRNYLMTGEARWEEAMKPV